MVSEAEVNWDDVLDEAVKTGRQWQAFQAITCAVRSWMAAFKQMNPDAPEQDEVLYVMLSGLRMGLSQPKWTQNILDALDGDDWTEFQAWSERFVRQHPMETVDG